MKYKNKIYLLVAFLVFSACEIKWDMNVEFNENFSGKYTIKLLINELKTADNLSAFFKTVLCYFDGLNFIISEGVLKGNITLEPRGKNGFGYDPIFDVNGKTLAEMTLEEKSNISHRKIAAVKLVEMLNENKV